MSLQQITTNIQGSEGIKKSIDDKSMDIVFDVLQVFAYSKPIESTVRELSSNAVDAQREKEIALQILRGEKKIEDFFVEKSGKEFEDSKFDLTYYDEKHLNQERNNVELSYIEGEGVGFIDQFVVRDYGVGLGGKRLEGYLSLGYSTKRRTKELLGSYGLGAKSGLSTGCPFCTVTSVHNGRLVKLNIFSKKIENLIGRFNEETGEENPYYLFKNDVRLYYENTTFLNFTEVSVPVKRLNEQKFIEAVKSQLLYLPGITFKTIDKIRGERTIDFAAQVIYNSNNLLISRNSQFSRPHLILVKDSNSNYGVCYNEINYKELELEQRYGAVGLKVQAKAVTKDEDGNEVVLNDGVVVSPSRETIVWNDETKEYLLRITKTVNEEAVKIVNEQLKETDFMKWLAKCSQILASISYGTPLYELSQMIDRESIKPTFSPNPSIKFANPSSFFFGLTVRLTNTKTQWVKSESKRIVERGVIEHWHQFFNRPLYAQNDLTSNRKDKYLCQLNEDHQNGFITFQLDDMDAYWDKQSASLKTKVGMTDEIFKKEEDRFYERVKRRDLIYKYIEESGKLLDYDSIEIPEDFNKAEDVIEENEKNDIITTQEEYRKLNGLVIYHTPRKDNRDWTNDLIWETMEIKSTEVPNISKRIYYGFSEDSLKLQTACRLLGNYQQKWHNKDIAIVRVSRKISKIIKKHAVHISEFFTTIKGGEIVMSPEVIKYLTAQVISKELKKDDYNFFENYTLRPDLSKLYHYLVDYSRENFDNTMPIRTAEVEKDVIEMLHKCQKFSIFAKSNTDDAALAEKSKELFGVTTITDCTAFEQIELDRLELLETYAESIKDLMRHIPYFSNKREERLTEIAERLLNVVLIEKGLDGFEIPEELKLEEVITEEVTN